MALIVVCPRCTSSLELLSDADLAAQVQCPVCEVEFSLALVVPRELPQVRVMERAVLAAEESPAADTIEEFSSEFAEPAADWEPPHAMRAPLVGFNVEIGDDEPSEFEPDAPTPTIHPEIQLGVSRLDQLLSELIKSSQPPTAPTTSQVDSPDEESAVPAAEESEPDFAEKASDPLSNDFDAELDDAEHGEPIEDEVEFILHAAQAPAAAIHEQVELRATPRRKRRSHPIRTLIGIVGGGAIGLFLGAYALLWIRGLDGDIAGLAKWLPDQLLPESARSMAKNDEAVKAARSSDELSPNVSDQPGYEATEQAAKSTVSASQTKLDPAVTPASATEPLSPESAPTPAAAPSKSSLSAVISELRDVQFFTLVDLGEALTSAKAAEPKLLTGDLARPETRAELGRAYIELARLAERYSLLDPSVKGNEADAQRAEAINVFHAVVADPAHRPSLGLIAARWLQYERRQNQGVVVAGRVRQLHRRDRWTECVLEMPVDQTAEAVTVVMDPEDLKVGQDLAVVGVIVSTPAQHLAGYQGEAPQIIVAANTFSPDTAKP